MKSGNTYTANGAAEMIKEIVANIKTDDLEIMFKWIVVILMKKLRFIYSDILFNNLKL